MLKLFSAILFTFLVGCANFNPNYSVHWKWIKHSDHPIVIVGLDVEELTNQRTFEVFYDMTTLKYYGTYVNGANVVDVVSITNNTDNVGHVRLYLMDEYSGGANIGIHFRDLKEDSTKTMDAIYRVVHRKMTQEEINYESTTLEFKI